MLNLVTASSYQGISTSIQLNLSNKRPSETSPLIPNATFIKIMLQI